MTIYGDGAPSSLKEQVYTELLASEPPMVDFLPIVRAHLAEVRACRTLLFFYKYFALTTYSY